VLLLAGCSAGEGDGPSGASPTDRPGPVDTTTDTAPTPGDTASGVPSATADSAGSADSADTGTAPFTPFTGTLTAVVDGIVLGSGATLALAPTTVGYAPASTTLTLSNPTDTPQALPGDPDGWLVGDERLSWSVPPPASVAPGDTVDVTLQLAADHEGLVGAELRLPTEPELVLHLEGEVHGPVPTVVVGRLGRTLVSWDHGTTWDDRQEITDPYVSEWGHPRGFDAITWGADRFVAVGGGDGQARISHSSDGTAWIDVKVGGGPVNQVAYGVLADGTGRFAALRGNDWLHSDDGELWIEEPADGWEGQNSLVFGGDRWVSVGNSYRGVSLDGQTWHATTDGASLSDVAYGDGVFVAVGDAGLVAWSTDGITWTEQTLGTVNRGRVAYGDGVFVTGGWPEGMYTSADGQTWAHHDVDEVSLLGFTNGTFVGSSWRDKLWTSADGVSWTLVQDDSKPEWAGFTAMAVATPPHLR